MELEPFELHQPAGIAEAVAIAAAHPGDVDFIAGGTDLLPNYKCRLNHKGHVVALRGVREMRALTATRLGALVTIAEIAESDLLLAALPVLPETAMQVSSPLLRNMGTLGGNICLDTRCYYFNQSEFWRDAKGGCLKERAGDLCLVTMKRAGCVATYSGDMAPVLITLGASVRLVGPRGERTVLLADFFRDDGIDRNVRAEDEVLTDVLIPPDAGRRAAAYRKLRVRDSIDFPLMGVAGSLLAAGGVVDDLRVCVNAVGPRPLPMDEVTAPLRGETLTPPLIERVAQEVMARVSPVRNVFLSTTYRRKMTAVFTRRVLTDLAARGRG